MYVRMKWSGVKSMSMSASELEIGMALYKFFQRKDKPTPIPSLHSFRPSSLAKNE